MFQFIIFLINLFSDHITMFLQLAGKTRKTRGCTLQIIRVSFSITKKLVESVLVYKKYI